jgi:thioredoxin-dependent peroxiredoxin
MRLKEGTKAPNFSAIDIYGNSISIEDMAGKKLYLGFFRNVHCPFCNLRVHELTKQRIELEKKGLKMIFLFESNTRQLQMSIFHKEVSPIPLIGDPEKKFYSLYGVESSTLKMLSTFLKPGTFSAKREGEKFNVPDEKESDVTMNLIPADFLIDENQTIVKAHYGTHLRDHIAIDEIKLFAE